MNNETGFSLSIFPLPQDNRDFSSYFKYLFLLIFVILNQDLQAQNYSNKQEVTLTFTYRGLINTYVPAYFSYDTEQFYLPVGQLFDLLQVPYKVNGQAQRITGTFQDPSNTFLLDFPQATLKVKDDITTYDNSKFILGELDYFVTPEVLNQLFGVEFTVDFNNLTLRLTSSVQFELEKAYERELQRKRLLQNNNRQNTQDYYPLLFGRSRKVLGGYFMDYNLSSSYSSVGYNQTGNLLLGGELLGGSLRGSVFGSYGSTYSTFSTNSLRWRYVVSENDILTNIRVGQVTSDGVNPRRHTGIQLTNEPITPKVIFDQYVIEGNAEPRSEVELYSNNSLIDFVETDESGRYRFQIPLSYGNPRYRIIIYRPDGSMEEVNRRFQIPFSFQQPGTFVYNLNAGQLEDNPIGNTEQENLYQGNIAYGVNRSITAEVGFEYLNKSYSTPYVYSSLSTRLGSNYLVSLDYSPDNFIRVNSRVIYPSSTSLSFSYASYEQSDFFTNFSDKEYRGTIFFPLQDWGIPLSFRINGSHTIQDDSYRTNYGLNLIGNIDRFRFQLGFNDRQFNEFEAQVTNNSQGQLSFTYSFPRTKNISSLLRGLFLRSQVNYSPYQKKIETAQLQFSRSLGKIGQIQLTTGRNFRGQFSFINAAVTLDFDRFRSISTTRVQSSQYTMQQNFSGSLSYDENTGSIISDARSQVGKSGATFRLFKDTNNSGAYEKGEEIIPNKAITIERSAKLLDSDEPYTRFSQIQPYIRTNAKINKANITNPILAPRFEEFSFYSSPNRYKYMDIPFYISGIIDGMVTRETKEGRKTALSGLRLYLVEQEGDFSSDFLTYNDGSFYEYEIPPGKYFLFPDASQLNFLKAKAVPDTISLEVESLPEGDFVEGLNFRIVPLDSAELRERNLIPPAPQQVQENVGATEINADKTENKVTSLDLNYSIIIDSLSASPCSYALQLSNYTDPSQLEGLLSEQNPTGSQIYRNSDTDSYFGYFSDRKVLLDSYESILSRAGNRNFSLLKKCIDLPDPVSPAVTEQYYLQFGAFSNEQDAAQFVQELNRNYSIESFIEQDSIDNLFKVRKGYYASSGDAVEARQQIFSSSQSAVNMFISKKDQIMGPAYPELDLSYELLLGNFDTARNASMYAMRIDETFGMKSRIVVDEANNVLLMLRNRYESWNEAEQLKNRIASDETFTPPVILSTFGEP